MPNCSAELDEDIHKQNWSALHLYLKEEGVWLEEESVSLPASKPHPVVAKLQFNTACCAGIGIRTTRILSPAVQSMVQNNSAPAHGVASNEKAEKSHLLNLNPNSKAWHKVQATLL